MDLQSQLVILVRRNNILGSPQKPARAAVLNVTTSAAGSPDVVGLGASGFMGLELGGRDAEEGPRLVL